MQAPVIAEHGAYLRRACSYLCTSHLGSEVVQDPAFLDPMQRYEELYTEYFNLYCSALVEGGGAMPGSEALLPLLKQQLHEYRLAILDPRGAQPFLRREAELRRPTGDTQRLPALALRAAAAASGVALEPGWLRLPRTSSSRFT